MIRRGIRMSALASNGWLMVVGAWLVAPPPIAAQAVRRAPGVNFGYPRPSPDGRQLLIMDDGVGQYEIVVIDRESGRTRRLTDHPAMDYAPDWSPDGRQIVFTSDRAGSHDLWLLSLDGDAPAQLLARTAGDEAHPRFTANGRSVVFARVVSDEGARGLRRRIMLMDLASRAERALTDGLHDDSYPELSPDGRVLLFRRSSFGVDSGHPEIVLRDMATGAERTLGPDVGRDDYPTWSPDGRWVAFASDRDRTDRPGFDVYRIRADGTGLERLTDGEAARHFYHRPAWSPDGRTLFANRGSPGRLDVVEIALDSVPMGPRIIPIARPTGWYPDLLDAEEERRLALSAAPTWLRQDARVMVLDSLGWHTTQEGSNGFTCLVVRDEYLARKPTCYDAEGSRTVLPFQLAVGEWTTAGLPPEAIRDSVASGLASGSFESPKRPGIAYMLSSGIRRVDPRTGESSTFPGHVMVYAPGVTERQLGLVGAAGERDHRLPFVGYEGPFGMIIILADPPEAGAGQEP